LKLEVSHRTTYVYEQPVALSQHRLHVTPRHTPAQRVLSASLVIEPTPSYRADAIDSFGNAVTTIDIEKPHTQLVIHARSKAEISTASPAAEVDDTPWDQLLGAMRDRPVEETRHTRLMRCMTELTRAPVELTAYVRESFPVGRPILEAGFDLTRRIRSDFTFDPRATDLSTPITTVFKTRRGVCQDFAHLMIAGLRSLGVPARYVSGYILTLPPPGRPKLQGADASHAWVAVWCGARGWIDLDPTNGRLVGDDYVTTAWGRDYTDVSPITGVLLGGGAHAVKAAVDVVVVE
jgi:transglutaminase-like putative cysteine protease